MTTAALFLCGVQDEAERLCLRNLDAIDGSAAHDNEYYGQYRERLVVVTPTGRQKAYGAAVVLHALGRCRVEAMVNGASLDVDDLLALPRERMFAEAGPEFDAEEVENGSKKSDGAQWPEPLDLAALSLRQPQPPRFVMADWLPLGYATLLAGHGGVGKSAIGLFLAVCIAMGLSFFGIPCDRLRVLYLSCEDREGILHWRLAHICAWLGVNMADLPGWLGILDLVGRDVVLWERDPRTGNTITPGFDQLARRIERDRPRVLMVDGVSDAFGGNENSRTEVKRFVNAPLSLLGPEGALFLLGHIAKPTASNSDTSEGYSGSTQWHNAVRARWYLYPETEKSEQKSRPERTGKLQLELQKSNLGRTDQAMTFEWNNDSRLFLATGAVGASVIDRKHRDQTEQIGILCALARCTVIVPAAMQGRRTAFNVLAKRPEFPASLKGESGRFWAQIEVLRQLRWIEEREYRRTDRHYGAQFVLTTEGRGQCGQ